MTLRIAHIALASAALAFAGAATANGPGGYMAHSQMASGETFHSGSYAVTPVSQDLRIDLDHSTLLRLPVPASAVVVGNPDIADVAVHRSDALLLLGRGYGSTSLLVMDTAGRVMAEYDVTVGLREAGSVRIHNGDKRSTFSCSPRCLPSPQLGDDAAFMGSFSVNAPQIQNLTAGSAVPANIGDPQAFGSPQDLASQPVAVEPQSFAPQQAPLPPEAFQPSVGSGDVFATRPF